MHDEEENSPNLDYLLGLLFERPLDKEKVMREAERIRLVDPQAFADFQECLDDLRKRS